MVLKATHFRLAKEPPLAKATKEKVSFRMRGEHLMEQLSNYEVVDESREQSAYESGYQEDYQEDADTGLIVILVVQTALLALLGYLYCSGSLRILL